MKNTLKTIFCLVLGLSAMSAKAQETVADMLRGEVAGVYVGSFDGNPVGNVNVNIRGINSLRSDNQPLYIVDGVMISQNLNDNRDAFWQYDGKSCSSALNPLSFLIPSEIESIEVLKDASATAIYGARGANGVVIIRTKRSTGRELDIRWNSDVSLNMAASGVQGYGMSHSHTVGVSGSAGGNSYNVSGSFRSIDGVLKRNGSSYGTVRGNYETSGSDRLVWFGLNALLSVGKSSSPAGTAWVGCPSYTLALRDPSLSENVTQETWLSEYDDDTEDYRGVMSAWLQLNFTRHLALKFSAGLDLQENKRVIWYGRHVGLGMISDENPNGGAASVMSSMLFGYNADARLTYHRYFNLEHNLTAVVGASLTGNGDKLNTINARNFVTDELRGKGVALGNTERYNHVFSNEYFHLGAYADITYEWKSAIGADLVMRADVTPEYGWDVKDLFPAASAWMNLAELLLPDNEKVSAIRLAGGYGWSGYEKYMPFEEDMMKLLTKEWHAGAKFGFLSDRLVFGGKWYDRITYGASSSVANRGLEFELDARPVATGKVEWNMNAVLAWNTNRLVSLGAADFMGNEIGGGMCATCNLPGYPVSMLVGYLTDSDGSYMDQTGEGLVTEADRMLLANTVPVIYGGFSTSVRIGGFTVSLGLDGAAGHHIANLNRLILEQGMPSGCAPVLSPDYVEKGDFLRVNELGLRYSVPVKVKWMQSLSVQLSTRNLCTFTGYSGWNPDVNSFGMSAMSNGLDYGSYPMSRSIVAGLSVTF